MAFVCRSTTLLTHNQLVIHCNLFLDKIHKQGLSLRIALYETVLYIGFFSSRLRKLLIHGKSWQCLDWMKKMFSQFRYGSQMSVGLLGPCMLHHHKHYFFLYGGVVIYQTGCHPACWKHCACEGAEVESWSAFFSLSFSWKSGKAMGYGKHTHVYSLNFTCRVSEELTLPLY